jgi:signal transduction histidine kinase
MSKEFLRRLPLFAGLSDPDLDQLYQLAELVAVTRGQKLIEEGDTGDTLYVVLDGMFEATKRSGQRELVIGTCNPGEVIGEMSLMEQAPRFASVCAITDSRLLKISQASFEQLLTSSPSAAVAVLHTVTDRLRKTEAMLRQSEKMAALGTMAAGLAHELNNPAAAVRRSVAQLREALTEWQRLSSGLEGMALDAGQAERLHSLRQDMLARVAAPLGLDPLTRSDREQALQTWLEEHGVEQAWELAPPLVSLGWDVATLETSTAPFPDGLLPVALQWLGGGSAVFILLDEAGQGAERISEIVKAVKSYTYLDQAPVQAVDVHEGLENTLVILRHKLKDGVTVRREYARDLPRIEAYGSELNQVWTNMIDNAIDAMQGRGELVVRTFPHNGHVVVEINDDGPGIPPEIQARIFEPFFTTKPPGVGAGLGLHIAYNIVAQKHGGQIQVISQPGATCFRVTLPVQLSKR